MPSTDEATSEVKLRLLGAVELYSESDIVRIGGPKPEALIARLILSPETEGWCSTASLVESLWPDDSSVDSKALHPHVSRLRTVLRPLGYDIEHRSDRYRIRPELVSDIDLVAQGLSRANSLVEAGDHVSAIDSATAAMSLWAEPIFGRLESSTAFAADRARVEEMLIQLLETRAAASSALGRWDDASTDLARVVESSPYRESAAAEQAVALYRSGRQRDALSVIETVRRRLREELGIEAGSALRDTELAILQQDPRLDPPRHGDAATPKRAAVIGRTSTSTRARRTSDSLPPLPVFRSTRSLIGREAAKGFLEQTIRERAVGLLSGPAGIGKSTVLNTIECPRTSGLDISDAPAMWPWQELLNQLGERSPWTTDETTDASFRQFVAVRDALRRSGVEAVVVDDAQLLSPVALQLLEFLAAQRNEHDPALLIGWRLEPDREPPIIGLIHDLQPLDDKQITSLLVRELGSRPSPTIVDEIVERTAGLPLLVERCANRLRQGASLAGIEPGAGFDVSGLSARTRRVLGVAALDGSTTTVEVVSACTGLKGEDVLDALGAPALRGITEADGRTITFTHDSWRHSVERSLSAAETAELHRRLASHSLANPQRGPLALARHVWGAGSLSDIDDPTAIFTQAGDAAHSAGSFDEAVLWWTRAIELADQPEQVRRLHELLGEAHFRSGRVAESRSHYRSAMEHVDDPTERAELAAAMAGLGLVFVDLSDEELAIVRAGAAVEGDDERTTAARLKCESRALIAEWNPETIEPDSEQLTALAERTADQETVRWTLGVRLLVTMTAARVGERLVVARQMAESAIAEDDDRALGLGLVHQADALAELGRFAECEHMIDQLAELGSASGRIAVKWYATHYRAGLEIARGNNEKGRSLLEQALLLAHGSHGPAALEAYAGVLLSSHHAEGTLAELAPLVDGGVEIEAARQAVDVWSMVKADVRAAQGDIDQARSHFETALESVRSTPPALFRSIELAQLAGLAWTLRDPAGAALAYEQLEPYADRCCAAPGMVLAGSARMYLGLAKAAQGDFGEAVELIDAAIDQNRRWGLHSWADRAVRARDEIAWVSSEHPTL